MNTSRPSEPWIGPEYYENQRNFPAEERLKYAGQYVAYSWDGNRIVASDPDDARLYEMVVTMGLDPSHVVFGYVDDGDTSCN